MNQESFRIADQLRRALSGDAWHGPNLSKTLSGITARQAAGRPLAESHGVWELVLHIELWIRIACDATEGTPMPRLYGTEKDWSTPSDTSDIAWSQTTAQLFESGERLAIAIEAFADARLPDTVPGRDYNFYYLFHGVVQHTLYHTGQIAILKRAG